MSEYLTKLFSLEGKNAVVIGGTGVLCGRMSECLALAGAQVVVAGRSEERGQVRADAIQKLGGKAVFLPVDVTRKDSVRELRDQAAAKFGHVDVLINGAGVNNATPYFEISDEDWERIYRGNVQATHWGCQLFGEHMRDLGGGAIINIGSVSAPIPLSKVFAYSSSKAAVVNYTQNVARELAQYKIRVNCLCPGFFPAEQNKKILSPERIERIFARTPMNRFGSPEELDGALLLLASAVAGSFITGACYYVDGGFTCMAI